MSKLLKDEIHLEHTKKLAVLIKNQYSSFDDNQFVKEVFYKEWPNLSLKERIRHITITLESSLNLPYLEALEILKPVSVEFSGLFHFIFSDYVQNFGLNHQIASLNALELFTQNSTAEFAIRAFLQKDPETIKHKMLKWSLSENHHLRRLASEGVRPKLPWATHIDWIAQQPDWIRPIIENLKFDNSRYVQKSVANLLNDFSKTQPEWLLDLAVQWLQYKQPETNWIIKHALRTLLKSANTRALALIGYGEVNHIQLANWCLPKQVKIGQKLTGKVLIKSDQSLGLLRIEYALHFVRATQKPYKKVFKIAESNYEMTQKEFDLTHDFKRLTTRNYLPGLHKIELIVNGQIFKTDAFELL